MYGDRVIHVGGSAGIEPPDYVKGLIEDVNAFQSLTAGTPESDEIGARMVEAMVSNLLFIGTAQSPAPIYQHNNLKNFQPFQTHSYEYYRTYPYRATQWYLAE